MSDKPLRLGCFGGLVVVPEDSVLNITRIEKDTDSIIRVYYQKAPNNEAFFNLYLDTFCGTPEMLKKFVSDSINETISYVHKILVEEGTAVNRSVDPDEGDLTPLESKDDGNPK